KNFRLLAEVVSGAPEIFSLLAGVYRAETLGEALERRSGVKVPESIITRDGIWVGPNWVRVVRESDTSAGVIERKQQLEALALELSEQQERVSSLSEALQECKSQLLETEKSRDQSRAEAEALLRKQSDMRSQLSAMTAKVEQVL